MTEQDRVDGNSDGRRAAVTVRAIALVAPAVVGFGVAWALLRSLSPFPSNAQRLLWVVVAIIVGIGASAIAARVVERLLPRTALYERAVRFDEALDSRYRDSLRRHAKMRIAGPEDQLAEVERVSRIISRLLSDLTRHERLTRGHSERVRAYAALIGEELELDEGRMELLSWSAVLHDVGKLDVDAGILTSPDKPNTREWEILRRHPHAADRKLRELHGFFGPDIADGALHHHERWDGNGYPDGIAGTDIPIIGRIVSVADAFDVMTHARSYKKPFPIEHARRELLANRGTQFDSDVVDAFLRIGEEKLRDIRGWSVSLTGTSIAAGAVALTSTTQAAAVVTSIAVGVVTADAPVVEVTPAVVAFDDTDETSESTSTTSISPTTTVPVTSTRVTTTTTTIPPTTTTTVGPVERRLTYTVEPVVIDGEARSPESDRLDVLLDDELTQSIDLEAGTTTVDVTISVLPDGRPSIVTLDLYDGDRRLSRELVRIPD